MKQFSSVFFEIVLSLKPNVYSANKKYTEYMDSTLQYTNKHQIRLEAQNWLARLERGMVAHQKQELLAWLKLSEYHKSTIIKQASLWDDITVINELSALMPGQTIMPKPGFWANFAIAATLCSIISISTLHLFGVTPFNQYQTMARIAEHKVESSKIGEQKKITLSDGSSILLNTNSKIVADYTDHQRRIKLLQGEAYFDVAKDKLRPFTVIVDKQSFTALGTEFNIRRTAADTVSLYVTEGKVLQTEANKISAIPAKFTEQKEASLPGIVVHSGEQTVSKNGIVSPVSRYSSDKLQQDLAWQQGMLIFNGEPLVKVMREMERYSNIKFTFANPDIEHIQVAGFYKAGDISSFLQSLESNFAIHVGPLKNQKIQLSAKKIQ